MDLVLFLATVKKISTTTVSVIRLVDYFAKNDPIHVKERLARSLEIMSEYMREKHQSTDPGMHGEMTGFLKIKCLIVAPHFDY